MKVIKILGDSGIVSTGGLRRSINMSFMKNIKVGDYVLVHAGFAIEKIKEEEAKKTLKAARSIKF